MLDFEVLHHHIHEPAVEIVAAQVGVAVRGQDLEDAALKLKDRNIEGAAAQIVHGDDALLALLEAVGQGGGGPLVDDPQYLPAGDLPGVLRGLTLAVVERGGNGNDGLADLLAEEGFGSGLELLEHHGRDLRRGERLVPNLEPDHAVLLGKLEREVPEFLGDVREALSHEALDRIDGMLGIAYALLLGRVARQKA